MKVFETKRATVDLSGISLAGKVLDIGGGGEGIISRVAGERVVSIDNRIDELLESPDIGLKIVMDGSDLKFLDGAFDTVTAFYSLMYMSAGEIKKVAQETFRVLKPGGYAVVFDTEFPMPLPEKDVFVKQLKVILPKETITTGYGVAWTRNQTKEQIIEIYSSCGFSLSAVNAKESDFILAFKAQKMRHI